MSADVEFDLIFGLGNLYLTQEGGIPLIPNRAILGVITLNLTDGENFASVPFVINSTSNYGNDPSWKLTGDPSLALISTTSEKYRILMELFQESLFNVITSVRYITEFIVSTNNNPEDSIKNFTFTPWYSELDILYSVDSDPMGRPDGSYAYRQTIEQGVTTTLIRFNASEEIITSTLSLNQGQEVMEMTFEDGIIVPTYIKQTEGAFVFGNLGLSQVSNIVEYFLVRDDGSTKDKFAIFHIGILSSVLITLVIVRKYKLTRNNV